MIRRTVMEFDAAPGARPAFKERFLWCTVMGLFFFLIYGTSNHVSGLTSPHPSFFWEWERSLPFVAELIVPYMSSDIVFVVAFVLAPTREAIHKLALRCGLAIVVSAAFFLAIPLEFAFQRPEVAGWPAYLFDLLSLDKPYNQLPSLHISLGFIAWHTIAGQLTGLARVVTTAWFSVILASTVLVFQHHVIDLPGGVLVAFLVFRLVPERGRSKIPLHFVSPRHLHMALRYLIVATTLVVIAFNLAGQAILLSVLLGWVAVSLLLVSASYALGLNGFLRKDRNGFSPLIWLLYGPYLIGSGLNWYYWRAKVPLMSEVAPGVWIGARPGRGDWGEIRERGIDNVVDLAPEITCTAPPDVSHAHIPLLDIAIPDPVVLDKIARTISDCRENGPVYVHCALGMSRSVLAVCAWLIRQGTSVEQALEALDRARPERVRRPYISITLDLFDAYIQGEACAASGAASTKSNDRGA